MKYFESFLQFVYDEQCALVIGPEIMRFDKKPMNMFVRDKLHAQFKDDLAHYYDGDGLFAFKPGREWIKGEMAKSFKDECLDLTKSAGFDEELLKNIARLPFHLIISANPDTFLSDVFNKYGVPHKFSFYRKGDKPSDEVKLPTRDEPLIYNISGCISEDESLILDYEDLFTLIKSSFGPSGLPQGLQSALRGVKRYIFLGFNFDKWHTQILLRILCGSNFQKNYAGPHSVTEETNTFLEHEFRIDFWKPEMGDFLTAFLDSAEKYKPDAVLANQPRLRQLSGAPGLPSEVNINLAIKNGQLKPAIDYLLEFSKGTKYEPEALQISGMHAHATIAQDKMDTRDYKAHIAKVMDDIIRLTRLIAGN